MDNTEIKNNSKSQTWWDAHRPSKRRLIQLYSALLYNAHLRGFISGEIYQGKAKALCVPGLNCYSCPGAVGACPLGSIQNALAYSGHRAGFYVLGIIMIFGLTLGRTICGWLCPMGLLQELLHKIPTPKVKKSRFTRALSYLKYVILAVFAVAIPMWYGIRHDLAVPGFCKYICPAGTFEGAVGLLANPKNADYFSMLNVLFTGKFVILLIIGLACVFCYRSFCRFLCPLGAIYGLFNRLSFVSVKVDESRCNSCGACVRKCQMDVRHVGDHECINCAKCAASCRQNALSLKAGTHPISVPAWGKAALAVLLCAALLWFDFLDPSLRKTEIMQADALQTETAAEVSQEAGEQTSDAQMPDFTAELIDGSSFHLADQRGKVVIINMWATYCGPCVKELPIFQDFLAAHGEDTAVLIIHASDPLEDVAEYLKKQGITLPCAIDSMDNELYNLSGASPSVLPHTVILNRKGEIVYNQTGSMTRELLDELFEKAS